MRFAPGFAENHYRLFEMDEATLKEVLANDGSVCVKGSHHDDAVLCTRDKTFVLRLAESSNTILLAPGSVAEGKQGDVQASVSAKFEIIPVAPRTGALAQYLARSPYTAASASSAATADQESCCVEDDDAMAVDEAAAADAAAAAAQRRLTMEELEAAVQCSGAELRQALQSARALAVDGRWCVLEAQLEHDIVECVLSLCVEREWPLDAVPVDECAQVCAEALKGVDEIAVRHCLRTHSTLATGGWDDYIGATQRQTVPLSADAIARFKAEALLSTCDTWPQESFMEAWGESLPNGHTPSLPQLAGLAIITSAEGETPTIQALPAASLPFDPKERFNALFKVRRMWSMAELEPYVKSLLDPGSAMTKLVLQHARSVTLNDGTVGYVPR